MLKSKIYLIIGVLLLIPLFVFAGAGTVYLVIGSDTAIWDGMSTSRYHCTYNPALYTNPADNAYAVMNMDFRNKLKDSYGTPMKLTWWMMAGNIFRYATNTNVPLPNTMTLYLMKKYHGDVVEKAGDELTLHYHTFKWSDYNNDGLWYWNQAKTFEECRADFDVTLSQFILQEKVFPVSFRSGWHYMDNDWQAYLNKLLPYSLHNAYPSKKTQDTEPLDNIIDWSQAPAEFIPYHPAADNYQVPGNTAGWNVRSAHLNYVKYGGLMDTVFAAAAEGRDQVACFWGHLPENDFVSNLEAMDSLAHEMANKYPDVNFRYCTAIEAMQRWQNSTDSIPPNIEISEENTGGETYFTIMSNEDIFQTQPYFAYKNIYEEYEKVECVSTGPNVWKTSRGLKADRIAKIGVAVCDSMGNQTIEIKKYLPDDEYIDNADKNFQVEKGVWSDYRKEAWQTFGVNSIATQLDEGEEAAIHWSPDIKKSKSYNLLFRTPPFSNQVDSLLFIINSGSVRDTIQYNTPVEADQWNYITTFDFAESQNNYIKMIAAGPGRIVADVVRVTPLVKDYDLQSLQDELKLGEVSIDDTSRVELRLTNNGIREVEISNIRSSNGYIFYNNTLPVKIGPMASKEFQLNFYSDIIGDVADTLFIASNDPNTPELKIPILAKVQEYFKILDNQDSESYSEEGEWFTSNAQAYGESSRCVYLSSSEPTYATFKTRLSYSGIYDIYEIVPQTVNAANKALYILSIANVPIDTITVNQNESSGSWVKIWRQFLPKGEEIEVKILDDGRSTDGTVLRADAIKFDMVKGVTKIEKITKGPQKYHLGQNYPNPFNSRTSIEYSLPEPGNVKLTIYNSVGQKVGELVNNFQKAGNYKIDWQAGDNPSGLYIYRLTSSNFSRTRKMLIIK